MSELEARYLDLSKAGMTTTQIAEALGILEDTLKDPTVISSDAYKRGRQSCKAFHEAKYQQMILDEAPTGIISAQQFLLKTQFKEDWSEKVEKPTELTPANQLSDEELDRQIQDLQARITA